MNTIPIKTLRTIVNIPVQDTGVAVPDITTRTLAVGVSTTRIAWDTITVLIGEAVVANTQSVDKNHVSGANAAIAVPG